MRGWTGTCKHEIPGSIKSGIFLTVWVTASKDGLCSKTLVKYQFLTMLTYHLTKEFNFHCSSNVTCDIKLLLHGYILHVATFTSTTPCIYYAFFANVHKMKAYRASHVCLSVRMIQLENRCTDLDEIWYGHYVTRDYPKIILFNFLQSVIPTWRTNKPTRWDRH
jgi:hypothetical protein